MPTRAAVVAAISVALAVSSAAKVPRGTVQPCRPHPEVASIRSRITHARRRCRGQACCGRALSPPLPVSNRALSFGAIWVGTTGVAARRPQLRARGQVLRAGRGNAGVSLQDSSLTPPQSPPSVDLWAVLLASLWCHTPRRPSLNAGCHTSLLCALPCGKRSLISACDPTHDPDASFFWFWGGSVVNGRFVSRAASTILPLMYN